MSRDKKYAKMYHCHCEDPPAGGDEAIFIRN